MEPIFVVSDDVTGCVDSGAIFLNGGCSVKVEVSPPRRELALEMYDVISVNMSSRTISGEEAKTAHESLARGLVKYRHRAVMKKMDIGFRGNASYEIEGLMRGLGAPVCFLMVHAPWRNTYTLDGRQYYEGVLLEHSIVAMEDPLKRPRRSDICGILSADTSLSVKSIPLVQVRGDDLASHIRGTAERGGRILVFDAVTEEDGCRVVRALNPLYPDALWAGSGGMAWALTAHFCRVPADPVRIEPETPPRCVCFCASKISTTRKQINVAEKECDLKVVRLDMGKVLGGGPRLSEIERAVRECLATDEGRDFLLMPNVPEAAERLGIERLDKQILDVLSGCAEKICRCRAFDRLIVIGGETAQAIFGTLGVTRLQLLERPEAGIGAGTILDGVHKGKSFSIKGGVCGSPVALCKMLGKWIPRDGNT